MKRLCITLGLVLYLVLNASGYAAENPPGIKPVMRVPDSSYNQGRYDGDINYRGLAPFGIGLVSGMLLPVATGVVASEGYDMFNKSKTAGISFGILTFAGGIRGTYELTKYCPTPAYDTSMPDMSSLDREQYRLGNEKGIADKRLARYTTGFILGPVVDFALLMILFKLTFHGSMELG
jgi:hypothetical protein